MQTWSTKEPPPLAIGVALGIGMKPPVFQIEPKLFAPTPFPLKLTWQHIA